MNILRSYDEASPAVRQIDDLISGAEAELKNLLLKNLAENADFYRLYQSSYFQSRLKVEEVSAYADPLMDIADAIEKKVNGLFDGIIGAMEQPQDWLDDANDDDGKVADEGGEDEDDEEDPEYFIDGLDGVLEELQNDVDSRANAFYIAAYERYKAYYERIELLAESINLPEAVLARIGETV